MRASSLKLRTLSSIVVVVPLLAVLLLMPPVAGVVVLAALVLAGAWEWAAFSGHGGRGVRGAYVLVVALLIVASASVLFSSGDLLLWLAVGWWAVAFVWLLLRPEAVPPPAVWLCGALALVPAWAALSRLQLQAGPVWLVLYLVLIGTADTCAYFAGRAFGRTRLAPRISPGKTWEGVAGAQVAVVLVAAAGAALMGVPWRAFVPLCIAVTLASIIGDLTVSMFKRHAGLKDSGSLFPGHGGILDRIDSIAAGAPLFVLGVGWLAEAA